MKSHDLAKQLLGRPDAEVILQKDSEGNGYSPLYGVDFNVVYIPNNTWGGDVYSTECSSDENCLEPDEWEEMKRTNSNYVVLFPTN